MRLMASTFTIVSNHAGTRLELSGDVPGGLKGYDGCTFTARLVGPPIDAAVEVYDIQPQNWSRFFRRLATDWRGWVGPQVHESLEHHLRLACTCDRTGHVTIQATLRGMLFENDWLAQASLCVDAGQLDEIARTAAKFFKGK